MKRRQDATLIKVQPRFEDARYEACKVCGLEWNVSKFQEIDWRGYICPRCRQQMRISGRNEQ